MKEIVVDGVVYVPKEEPEDNKKARWGIAVLERGYVYVGIVQPTYDGEILTGILIKDARCIIRWGTSKHLGELANGPLPNTKLGEVCKMVRAPLSSVIHIIDVEADKWKLN